MTPAVSLAGVEVRLGGATVLDGVDLAVGHGEVVCLLGPSGSGKTTLLSAVAGFVGVETGTIDVAGVRVSGGGRYVPPERRNVGFVFQSYALWPHLGALDTVAFPLEAAGTPRAEARRRAATILERLGIGDLGDRRPAELSGGQQQRVGLARALASEPDVFLLDEPTAHLDPAARAAAEELVAAHRAASGAAALVATHDAAEALGLADRVALLRDGRIVQVGSPTDVYDRPVDAWAAALTGPVSVLTVDMRDGAIVLGDAVLPVRGAGDGRSRVALRPEWAALGGPARGRVVSLRFRGPHTDVVLDTPAGRVLLRVREAAIPAPGDVVGWRPERVWPLGTAGPLPE
ncbi:MAG: ABC transporter ATP-binding protein [Acidimicrobiia bacterium]|nr:ABC transporter ATP-binding protein [Acidimicrobiia bacterium]